MKLDKMMKGRVGAGALVLLLGFGLLLAGCESDPVAPDDELPALTEQETAQQAALVAVGVAQVGPRLVTFNGTKAYNKVDGVYPYTFPPGGDISGSIVLEYFNGGPNGVHSVWDLADYGLLYTSEFDSVTVALDLGGGVEPIFSVTFDLEGPIDREEDTATVSGTGTFSTGGFFHEFSLADVLLDNVSSYPDGGTMVFTGGPFETTVTYDGTRFAHVAVTGGPEWVIDLDTARITLIED